MRRKIINLMLGFCLLAAVLSACGGPEENGNTGGNSISGTISLASTGAGVLQVSLTLFGSGSGNTFTDSNGFYRFSGLQDGTYNIIPSKTGYTFLQPELRVTVSGASLTDQNFLAFATAPANLTLHGTGGFAQPPEGPHTQTGESTDFLSAPPAAVR